jgi:alpha-L-arabinofuranosidase
MQSSQIVSVRAASVRWSCLFLPAFVFVALAAPARAADEPATIRVDLNALARPISGDLFGIFFEDLNYAADGGLYAELVQNRSFEYRATERPGWGPLTEWEVVSYGGGRGTLVVDAGRPVHPNNPHYGVLDVATVGDGVGIGNRGFDGIVVRAGETYDLTLFARQLYLEKRWGGRPIKEDEEFTLVARLEAKDGKSLGETTLEFAGTKWQHLEGVITATGSDDAARLVVFTKTQGGTALDVVSLFPRDTFRRRKNGLRKDLAETLAALAPKFVRFPGGCLVHGNGLPNMYRWKDTIGPIEERREQANLWGYHQTVGLGYYEYFQFCEDIGAKPLPVVPAAVCCQNSGHTAGAGQDGLPLDEMPAYIQEVLDLVEWANGPATSTWGARRAAAGHPEPFNLKYLGVGNEEHITPVFEERFRMINAAIAEKHPEITVIGTVGPFPDGPDFEEGWRIADRLRLPMIDEHYYRSPDWFLSNLRRYDAYDRGKSHVYLGEYAAHEPDRRSTLRSALAEAAYMTQLERNGDVVRLASYAPLLAKQGHTQWNPDLIYFSNTEITPTINYYVQQMFGANSGDELLVTTADEVSGLATSSVRDSKTGDVILKLVNVGEEAKPLRIELAGGDSLSDEAECTILAGDPLAVNEFGTREPLLPEASRISAGETIEFEAPPHSFSVLRIKSR